MVQLVHREHLPAATLVEHESANGNRCFTRPFGNAKAIMFRDNRDAPDGSAVWTLFVQDSGRPAMAPGGA